MSADLAFGAQDGVGGVSRLWPKGPVIAWGRLGATRSIVFLAMMRDSLMTDFI